MSNSIVQAMKGFSIHKKSQQCENHVRNNLNMVNCPLVAALTPVYGLPPAQLHARRLGSRWEVVCQAARGQIVARVMAC